MSEASTGATRAGDGLHVGLVGCGKWGRHILRDLRELGARVTVVARSDASIERARERGAEAIVGAVGELPDADAYVICSPTHVHAQHLLELAPRGVPMFVEKPLCVRLDDAHRVAEACGDRVFVMDKWRYHPGVEELARIAHEEEFGPVVGLHTRRISHGNPHDDVDGVWILLPHDLSIAREVLGHYPEPRSAVGFATDGHAQGLTAILGGEPWFVTEVSVRGTEHLRAVRLHCRDAVVELADGYAEEVLIHTVDEQELVRKVPYRTRPVSAEWPLVRELRAFLEHVRGGPAPKSGIEDAVAAVECMVELRRMAGLVPEHPPA